MKMLLHVTFTYVKTSFTRSLSPPWAVLPVDDDTRNTLGAYGLLLQIAASLQLSSRATREGNFVREERLLGFITSPRVSPDSFVLSCR